MPIIRADSGIITQINMFIVPDGGQQALIDHLQEAAVSCRTVPGWLSASLHRSLDGRRVFEHLQSKGFLERNKALGEAHPGLYEVACAVE